MHFPVPTRISMRRGESRGKSRPEVLSCATDRPFSLEGCVRGGNRLSVLLALSSLALMSVILLGHRLASTGLWTDESIYAETAREMARSGDGITPKLCGRPYLIKPPLYHWLAALSFHVLGPGELAARLPQVAAGTATVLILGALSGKIFGRKAAWLAGAALLTSPGFLVGSRVAGMDVLLT